MDAERQHGPQIMPGKLALQLLGDPALGAELGREGRERALERYRWDALALELLAAWQRIAQAPATRRPQLVAEGIEDKRSLDMLVNMGCDYGQGFYIARPMPAAQLNGWLQQAPWRKPAA